MTWMLTAITACGLAAIASDWQRRRPSFYLFKPLTTVLIIALTASTAADGDYRNWILSGLALCLLGDICLMWSSNRAFVIGLSAFLLGHVGFVIALLSGLPTLSLPWWGVVPLLLGIPLAMKLLPRAGRLKLPVLCYCLILMALAESASVRYQVLGSESALLALLGCVLFVLSDSILGIRRFVQPPIPLQPAILSSYWAGITLIGLSA